ncbi:outer envelope pore protein 37 [Pyrus ussuriensis x Pyrus communis]|uniref:Outer envelope pore protein 37 n=1 Tax=Pyrus ussuriensis x Pyrus communis TaxID=2448454 RepID=A0A5N5IIJ8_9ROSA|nr:outer envelope pore protein 37 [Pyrus ussuriensis x Pyrus communis]
MTAKTWRSCCLCLGFCLTSAVAAALCKEGKAAACSSVTAVVLFETVLASSAGFGTIAGHDGFFSSTCSNMEDDGFFSDRRLQVVGFSKYQDSMLHLLLLLKHLTF